MKNRTLYLFVLSLTILFAGCELDNYEEPSVVLNGSLVYNGEALNLSSTEVDLQLWEQGWELDKSINVNIDQVGKFQSLMFAGTYKLVIPQNQGPFMAKADTTLIELPEQNSINLEVTPYYLVQNAQFSSNGQMVSANFSIEKVINDSNAKDIDKVFLYINKTSFVDKSNNIKNTALAGGGITNPGSVSMDVEIPELNPTQSYVFARVGLKIKGVEDMIFSPVVKLDI